MSSELDPDTTVVVPTGGGTSYHSPDGHSLFETTCKTEFGHPVRTIPLSQAIDEGFSPCGQCFTTRGARGFQPVTTVASTQ